MTETKHVYVVHNIIIKLKIESKKNISLLFQYISSAYILNTEYNFSLREKSENKICMYSIFRL